MYGLRAGLVHDNRGERIRRNMALEKPSLKNIYTKRLQEVFINEHVIECYAPVVVAVNPGPVWVRDQPPRAS